MELKYDGLLEIHPDDIEDHQKVFESKIIDGKVYFPFKYIEQGYYQRCYGMIKKKRKYTRKIKDQ